MNVEVFSCAGGMAEGFRRAGIWFDLVIDKDPDACASYEKNLGHKPWQVDLRDALHHWGGPQAWRGVDLFVADPPCTPWSTAGKRKGLEDERDMLQETCEAVRILRPRCFVIANVPGLETLPNRPVVYRTIGALADLGYRIDFANLDAADYGVPQHRRRPFWIGRMGAQDPFRWPAPTHHDPLKGERLFGDTRPWVTCGEALAHLEGAGLGRSVSFFRRTGKIERNHVIDRPARTLTTNQRAANTSGTLLLKPGKQHRPSEPARTVTTKGNTARGGGALALHERHPPSQLSRPARTITARERHHENGFMSQGVILSERARAILQGFPEDWVFIGKTKKSRDGQIGMAMPPPLAEAVAHPIRIWLEQQRNRVA